MKVKDLHAVLKLIDTLLNDLNPNDHSTHFSNSFRDLSEDFVKMSRLKNDLREAADARDNILDKQISILPDL
jgi:hypothetical protein